MQEAFDGQSVSRQLMVVDLISGVTLILQCLESTSTTQGAFVQEVIMAVPVAADAVHIDGKQRHNKFHLQVTNPSISASTDELATEYKLTVWFNPTQCN